MRLNRVLAATLAAFFVGGCSTRPNTGSDSDKSPAPTSGATVGAQEKPVQPSHEETLATAPEPQASLSPAETAAPPGQNQDHPEDRDKPPAPPEPPDPYAGVSFERRPYYEQFEEFLVPYLKAGIRAAFEPKLHQHERKARAVVKLGEYKVSANRKDETRLRALLPKAKDTEIAAQAYLAAVTSLLTPAIKNHLLDAAYEQVIDKGTDADIPAETRKKLAELVRWEDRPAAFGLSPERVIGKETEDLRTKLLEQSVWGNDLFSLALSINSLGESVIERRELCRTFHDLLVALPEPHRTDILIRLAWSPDQERALDQERADLMDVRPSLLRPSTVMMLPEEHVKQKKAYANELAGIIADRQAKFRALEQIRRNTIEGCFRNVDAPGWKALRTLDELVGELQVVLDKDKILLDLGYRFQPLIPDDAPQDEALNILTKIPLPGSVEDRVPTMSISGEQIVFDAPVGQPSYAEVVKPGNVLVGTVLLKDQKGDGRQEIAYHAELRIRAIEKKKVPAQKSGDQSIKIEKNIVEGELVLETSDGHQGSFPFEGGVGSTGFYLAVPWGDESTMDFTGSLDKGGPLTGEVRHDNDRLGSFSFVLKK